MAQRYDRELHARYFLQNLRALPAPYASQDSQRVVLAFFCVHGLALLGELDRVDKQQLADWIYALQVHPDARDRGMNAAECGFRGGTFMGNAFSCSPTEYQSEAYDTSNIASTYAAICMLKTIGDDLSRLNKPAIVGALRHLQDKQTGCFASVPFGSEEDMRFVFCACAISYMLDDWSGVDVPAVVRYVNSCLRYDGGIGIAPGAESHGGAAYCAIAALVLAGRMMQLECDQGELARWLVFRQQGGFQGRVNKDPDSCYAFWDGATLDMLGKHALVDVPSCERFIFSCQFPFGGLCKFPDTVPDVMHSYYSLAWLSIASNASPPPPPAAAGESESADASTEATDRLSLPKLAPLDTKLQVPFFPKPKRT